MWTALGCWFTLHGVVDAIEGDVAVVEWQVRTPQRLEYAIGFAPLTALPPDLREGDRVRVRPNCGARRRPVDRTETYIEIPVSLMSSERRVVRRRPTSGVPQR